jgi:hypothetical protein
MKRLISLILSLLLLFVQISFADDYAIFGGIKGDLTLKAGVYYYQEVIFLSGEPIILSGTATIPVVPDKDTYTLSIKYSLANTAAQASLERTVNYNIVKNTDNSMGQTIIDTTIPVGGLKETIIIGAETFNLTSYQYSKSNVSDHHPGIDFESGNVYFKKVFHINGDETNATSKMTIIGESQADIGFTSQWSTLTTRIVSVNYSYETIGGDTTNNWDGTSTLKFSTQKGSEFNYVLNDVQHISFRGGLLKTENSEVVLQYSYDLPGVDDTGARSNSKRKKGEENLNTYTFETSTRLPVPKYNDLGGHWAEEEAFRMGSLEAFDTDTFFFPDVYVTREQFARAILNTIDFVKPETLEERKAAVIRLTRPNAEVLPFEDVRRDSLYYIYIDRAYQEGLMLGEGNGQFLPSRPLTRAEAITIMIRAIGIEDIAPALPYNTGFSDDASIPIWSKDAFYMARETGIINGYPDGSIRPLQLMTRAESAKMLSDFIDHMRQEITIDYRDKLMHQY